jgi:hypothetical protein
LLSPPALVFAASIVLAATIRAGAATVTQSADTAGEAFAFLNKDTAGGGLSGQVGPSVYSATHAGLAGIFNPAATTVGYGVFGLSTTGYGVFGRSTATGYAGVYGTATGNAVVGASTAGSGVLGQTSAANNVSGDTEYPFDSSTYSGRAGVFGNDISGAPSSGHADENVGLAGFTRYGLAGVMGVESAGTEGYSAGGVLGVNFGHGDDGVLGYDASGSTESSGLHGSSTDGTGTTTFSINGEGFNAYSGGGVAVEADNTTTNSVPALLVQGGNTNSSNPLFIARNNYGGAGTQTDVFSIGSDGTVIATGAITGSSSPLAVTRSQTGARYVAYGMRASTPTIEDVGSATLTGGYALVHIEPTFASTLDRRTSYAVFLSPEGDNDGLYVTSKMPGSFVVRESRGGKSTLPFSYRIVARPVDMPAAKRLPDAATAIAAPVFDDRLVQRMDRIRSAARRRFTTMFGQPSAAH